MKEIDDKIFIAALNRVAATEDGQIVFAILKDSCQWEQTYLASNDPVASHFYAVKRGVYGGLRQHIKSEHLKKIEFDYTRKVKQNDRASSRPRATNPTK
jgi:hypothetical protein